MEDSIADYLSGFAALIGMIVFFGLVFLLF
jgi:hypothetical protein